jgi:hypothetical protein
MRNALTNSGRIRALELWHSAGFMVPPVWPSHLCNLIDMLSETSALLDSSAQIRCEMIRDQELQTALSDLRTLEKRIADRARTLKRTARLAESHRDRGVL